MKKNFIQTALLCVFIISISVNAFGYETFDAKVTISGPKEANLGSTHTYFVPISGEIINWNWTVSPLKETTVPGATITSQNATTAIINWSNVGSYVINYSGTSLKNGISMSGVIYVTVIPAPPTIPVIISQNCTQATLQRENPPSGVIWYWQGTNQYGESRSNANTTYQTTTSGKHFIRAWKDRFWSEPVAISVVLGSIGGSTWFKDQDNDGLGDPNIEMISCSQPAGYVSNNNDQCPYYDGGANTYGCPDFEGVAYENYIYTITPKTKIPQESELENNDEVIKNITYFDGLGRPKQSIAHKAGGQQQDIITPMGYDGFGRQTKEYLPYARTSNSLLFNASLVPDSGGNISILNSFYDTKFPNEWSSSNAANPYSEKQLDNSPLNRVLQQAAPGEDWKIVRSNTIQFAYQTNLQDEVYQIKVSFTGGQTDAPSLDFSNSRYYDPNTLYKTITKDENWQASDGKNHTTEEFKNKQGQVVLKITYSNSLLHNTYYVYDDFGNLTYVIPPKVNLTNGVSSTELSELCYQYKYDDINRLIEKKIPGKDWESIVYDKLDRPVLTQDAVQKTQQKWNFTKYDNLGRVAYTGIVTSSNTRSQMQSHFNAVNDTALKLYETKKSSGTGFDGTYYTNSNFPYSNLEILTVNYYDNYTFNRAGAPTTVNVHGVNSTTNLKSLATGSRIKVLDQSPQKWITTVTYYDEKARPIYMYSKNEYLETTDISETKLEDFTGKVLQTRTVHNKTGQEEIVTIDTFSYDHADRLLDQYQCVGGSSLISCNGEAPDHVTKSSPLDLTQNETQIIAKQSITLAVGFEAAPSANQSVVFTIDADAPAAAQLIVSNSYDELGQLKSKKVGNSKDAPLQTVDYTYNIRGWLTNINQDTQNDSDLFNFTLRYNNPTTGTALYNGNISQTSWNTANVDSGTKTYSYAYDALNRITGATGATTSNYNVSGISYDKNGNIKTLLRRGHTNPGATSFGTMDNLVYTYDIGNKLKKVKDNGNDTYGFKDGIDTTTEYVYDINGNMTKDDNKGISAISYNHLNLPTSVSKNSNNIQYVYDATGVKLSKTVNSYPSETVTQYAGNYIYENDELQFFNHAEGYVKNDNGNFSYIYQYKDHLGNVRLSYSDTNNDGVITASSTPSTNEIIEESNYYPFGLKHKGYNNVTSANVNSVASKFKYNGVELEESLGLNLYEMEFRQYDPAIVRFTSIDPVTHYDYSPYQAFDNNPVFFADPSGADSEHDFSEDIWGRNRYDSFTGVYIPSHERGSKSDQNSIDKVASKALQGTAKLYLGGENASNLTEKQKQRIFEKDELGTIGILLHEFATGTGPETRKFVVGKHAFATSYTSGRILEEIIEEFSAKLRGQGYDFNALGDTGVKRVDLEFSPDIKGWNPGSWMESAGKHADSNHAQFFIGGSTAKVSIKDQNLMIQVYNETSRKSLFLHLPFVKNYKRTSGQKNKPLSTIKQYINASFPLQKQ